MDIERIKKMAHDRYMRIRETISKNTKAERISNPEKYAAINKRCRELGYANRKNKQRRQYLKETNPDLLKEIDRCNNLKYKDIQKERREYKKLTDPNYRKTAQLWERNNKDKRNFNYAKRRAAKLNATPKWLTDTDWNDIRRFYKVSDILTRKTGIKYTVDHIHPLQGKEVCGLHVPWNMQILTDKENTSKGIKLL